MMELNIAECDQPLAISAIIHLPSSISDPPHLTPCLPFVLSLEGNDAVKRKCRSGIVANEQRQKRGQMRKVPDDHEIANLTEKAMGDGGWRVDRLQVARDGELRGWTADAPERLTRLTRAKLAAMPDHRGPGATRGGRLCCPCRLRST
jgi:hypothetical protein